MPPITALLHTKNDGLRLGRTLEMLLPCAEFLIIDHGSSDDTRRVACRYGARILMADDRSGPAEYLNRAHSGWILCMEPGESINESLQASLFEWSVELHSAIAAPAYCVAAREQAHKGEWLRSAKPLTRLVPSTWQHWEGRLPKADPSAVALEGELLRFPWP